VRVRKALSANLPTFTCACGQLGLEGEKDQGEGVGLKKKKAEVGNPSRKQELFRKA